MSLWDPERLQVVGTILERCAPHISEGHRIRLGMEGDPCYPYRRVADAPVGSVVGDVHRFEDGTVRFTLRMDGTDEMIELDNRNVERIWEIEPSFIPAFRGSIDRDRTNMTVANDDADQVAQEDEEAHGQNVDDERYRGHVETRFSELSDRMARHEDVSSGFREVTASTLRYIAADLLRVSRGEPIEFAQQYADRYDVAFAEREEEIENSNGYRGDISDEHGSHSAHQDEKTDFDHAMQDDDEFRGDVRWGAHGGDSQVASLSYDDAFPEDALTEDGSEYDRTPPSRVSKK